MKTSPSTSPNVTDSVTSKTPFFRSVFLKCIALTAFAAAAVAVLTTMQSLNKAESIAEDGVRTMGKEVVSLLADKAQLVSGDSSDTQMQAILDKSISNSGGNALYALMIDGEGNVVLESGSADAVARADLQTLAGIALATGAQEVTGDGFYIASPTQDPAGGAFNGAIAIIWSPEPQYVEIASAKQASVLLGAGALLTFLVLSGVLLRAMVSAPLTRVSVAIAAVAEGRYDVTIPGLGRGDEIGRVGRSVENLRLALAAAAEANRDAIMKGTGFDASSAAMILTDDEMRIVGMNNAFRELAELRRDELKKMAPKFELENLIGMQMDEFHKAPHTNRETLAKASFPHSTTIQVDDVSLSLTLGKAVDEDGNLEGYVLEWNDETETQKTGAIAAALNESQVQLEFTPNGTVKSANARFDAVMGPNSVALGKTEFDHLFVPKAGLASDVWSSVLAGETWFGKAALKGPKTLTIDATICPIKGAKGKVIAVNVMGKDITDAEAQAEKAEALRAQMEADQASVVEKLRIGLAAVAKGDVTSTINDVFPGDYDTLRADFNNALKGLDDALMSVVTNAVTIRNEAGDITSAADDLSKRTEHQAATLEETSAALTEIARSVASAAKGADEANHVVVEARENAEESGGVVRQAVSAMGEIEASSDQISRIISVIDDIAFQTNLLALNAGVEAARAGDAGRGFAVVASEVRALAQRSSEAAREINDLISRSGSQVKHGVQLVGQAGEALERIVASVSGIAEHVSTIATSAAEQATALEEVTGAMNQLDNVTQQNAAMFEETTAASHALTSEAKALTSTISRFKTSSTAAAEPSVSRQDSAGSVTETDGTPTFVRSTNHRTPPPKPIAATHGNAALDLSDQVEEDWEDF